MLNLIIIGFLLFGFVMGLRRGLVLQLLHLLGFVLSFLIAFLYYDKLAEHLPLWIPYPELPEESNWAIFLDVLPLEAGFYNAISFVVIFIVAKIILQIIASMLDFVAELPLLNSVNKLLGSILGFVEIYLILFIILYVMALTPFSMIQNWINDSSVALFILENTPILSEKIKEILFQAVDRLAYLS